MGITLILIGFFFLLNPNIVILDLLPDCIGYLFILLGLRKWKLLNLSFSESFDAFQKLLILSLVRIPASLLYVMLSSDSDEVWGLIFTFAFGLLDTYYAWKAFTALFSGLRGLSDSDPENKISTLIGCGYGEVRGLTTIFVVLKSLLALLPELTTLSSSDYGTVTTSGIQSMSSYRYLFTVLACLIGLLIGIYWYIRIFLYFRRLGKNTAFLAYGKERYQLEITEHEDYWAKKRLLRGLSVLAIGSILALEFKFDGFNYLPHPIFIAVIVYALSLFRPDYPKQSKSAEKCGLCYLIVSALCWAYSLWFIRSFYSVILDSSDEGATFSISSILELNLGKRFDILYEFIGYIVAAAIDSLLFILFLLFLRRLLLAIVADHTGGTYSSDGHLIGEKAIRQEQKMFHKLIQAFTGIGILSGLSAIAQAALLPYFAAYWILDFLIRVLWIAIFFVLIRKIQDSLKDRYTID
jgi:hypothetical protein